MRTTSSQGEIPLKPARRLIIYSWEEYLEVIKMMGEGNQIPDDFEVEIQHRHELEPKL